jgi:CheY-like chemotaxis protein
MHQILVIDDQQFILDTVRQALTMYGYEVEIAADGQEGIQKFDDGSFDLVITDMQMPGIDGNNVVEHIRNSDRHLTPIIGFSGTPWLLKESDFDIVFAKPFPLKDLVNAIQDLSAKFSKAVGHI